MKKFLIKISYTIFPLWLYTIGVVSYLSLYVVPNISGDIGNLAVIPFGHEYDGNLNKGMMEECLFKTIGQTDSLKLIQTQVLTIGDSFSQLKQGGYQNYLCKKGISVTNCDRFLYSSPLQYAYQILDTNVIDSTNIEYLIVEIVERSFEDAITHFDITNREAPQKAPEKEKDANMWSITRARDWTAYKLGINTPIYVAQLDKQYFSSDDPQKLYFYHHDIELGTKIKHESEKKIVQVFSTLCIKAKEKGVKLILMVAVDKYDLYQRYIVENPFPAKTVNEDIERILGKSPHLFLSKPCLVPLLERGEKDIFRFNDTHWSYKASEIVADKLYDQLQIL